MQMEFNPFSLAGKTILVTGASSGIGQTTAIVCSQMGATVVITGRDEERLQATFDQLAAAQEEHVKLLADLTIPDEVDRLVASLPPLDGVVLCAGNSTTLRWDGNVCGYRSISVMTLLMPCYYQMSILSTISIFLRLKKERFYSLCLLKVVTPYFV